MKTIKRKLANGPQPGETNYKAIAKVSVLAIWLVVPALVGQPLFPLNYAGQYVEDVYGFAQNNTTWWALTEQGRWFYVLFPLPWLAVFAAWYEGLFRQRRKRLFVNGREEGIAILSTGVNAPREGHLYDLACAISGFRHITWGAFPRLYLKPEDIPPNTTVYYRSSIFSNPFRLHKISVEEKNIIRDYAYMFLTGKHQNRVRHPAKPICEYEVLSDDASYACTPLSFAGFQKTHRDYQEQILKDNYRMTQGEPGVAKMLVRSSLMTISEDTRMDYFDQLSEDEQKKFLATAREGGVGHGSGQTSK